MLTCILSVWFDYDKGVSIETGQWAVWPDNNDNNWFENWITDSHQSWESERVLLHNMILLLAALAPLSLVAAQSKKWYPTYYLLPDLYNSLCRELCLPDWVLLGEHHSQQQGEAELRPAWWAEDAAQPELHRELRAGDLRQAEAPVQLQDEGRGSQLQYWRQGSGDLRQ